MSHDRTPIPERIKREVRQRCGFGCVFCGIPLYHYDHIEEYAIVKEHTATNITLLCANHHDLKTRGLLSSEVVRTKDAAPYTRPRGQTSSLPLFYFGDRAEIIAGGNHVSVAGLKGSAMRIDGHSLVDFELVEGSIMLNLDFRDRVGLPVLRVQQNELIHSTHLWDYNFVGQRLSIRERSGLLYLIVGFDTDRRQVVINEGLVSHNGIDLFFNPRGFCILNNRSLFRDVSFAGMGTAISVGHDLEGAGPAAIQIAINRGPYDKQASINWARKQMN